jgi:hypothetical protein
MPGERERLESSDVAKVRVTKGFDLGVDDDEGR